MKLSQLFSDMTIRKKLLLINIIGVILPMLVLFTFFSSRISNEFREREDNLIEEGMNRVDHNFNNIFESMEKLSFSYLSDNNLNQLLETYSSESIYQSLTQFHSIEDKATADVYAYDYVSDITLYHTNIDIPYSGRTKFYEPSDMPSWYESFYSTYTSEIVRLDEHGSYYSLHYMRKLNARDQDSLNYIEIEVNLNILEEQFVDKFFDNYNAKLYLVDEMGHIVLTNDASFVYDGSFKKEKDLTTITSDDNSYMYELPVVSREYLTHWSLWLQIDRSISSEILKNETRSIMMIFIAIAIIASALIWLIADNIRQRLARLNKAMSKAQQSNLTQVIGETGSDEIGKTVVYYNKMVDHIQDLIRQIEVSREKAEELLTQKSTAYEELEKINEELAYVNGELSASHEEIRVQDERIHSLIYIDALTGLKNRFAINKTIEKALGRAKNSSRMAVVFLDVDNFKYINDTFGHNIGDYVIGATGERLKSKESSKVTMGRFGGDEFLILIEDFRDNSDLFETIKAIENLFELPIIVEDNRFYLTVSIGISRYPDNGFTLDDLMKKADQALYKAKEYGKNQYIIYDEAMNKSYENKIVLQRCIREATKNKDFHLNYQPYVEADTGRILGFEALIRWKSQEFGYVSPYVLIVNAEEMGIIIEIGDWIIREACGFIKRVNEGRRLPLTISINISAVQLMNQDFDQRMIKIVNSLGVAADQICLEMTETILLGSIEKGVRTIGRLKDYGFGIALDDFGTGYSSLSYFKELPVSILKIDKSFIDEIATDNYNRDLVATMLRIAHNRDVIVNAEGVEDKDQLDILIEEGCDIIQGYYFSKPLSEEDALDYIKKS